MKQGWLFLLVSLVSDAMLLLFSITVASNNADRTTNILIIVGWGILNVVILVLIPNKYYEKEILVKENKESTG